VWLRYADKRSGRYMNNIMEIDLSKRLEITINNKNPVGLEDLFLCSLAFNHQFQKFVESELLYG
jgi:hypothetical protein